MKGCRSRNVRGPLRDKRDDTHVSTIEKRYSRKFNVRGDMHLDTLLKKLNKKSLNDLITGR
jgi:predicted HicB family RNase H-like nuclease